MNSKLLVVVAMVATGTASASIAESVSPKYPHTINCESSKVPKGWDVENSCDLEGDFSKIIERPLPEWYADIKFGIFIHWGVYSVPSYGTEWYWHNVECGNTKVADFQNHNFGKNFSYLDFSPMFHAELFNASAWVEVFKNAGVQYILPVGKHHDGFCMWDATETSPGWNAYEVGPKRDVLTEVYNATLAAGLDFGIYYSQFEWFDKDFVEDWESNYTTRTFVEKKVIPQRLELVNKYPKAMLWHTDGGWMAPDAYWGNLDWLTYLYGKSPLASRVVSCNSMGFGCCKLEGQKCFEYGDAPSGGDRTTAGYIVPHYYTNQMTIQKSSWSWDRSENTLDNFLTTDELIFTIVSTTAWNGTTVINVGPTADGLLPPIFQQRLADMGTWMAVNSEAIYSTRPFPPGQDGSDVFYTQNVKTHSVYAISLRYPTDNTLVLNNTKCATVDKAELLTSAGPIEVTFKCDSNSVLALALPPSPLGSQWGWVVRLSGLN